MSRRGDASDAANTTTLNVNGAGSVHVNGGRAVTERSDPRFWHVNWDKDGFFIEDDYGEDCLPGMRWRTRAGAKDELDAQVSDYLKGEMS